MQLHREFKCCAGCCWCAHCDSCRQEVTVESPPGNLIGTITQEYIITWCGTANHAHKFLSLLFRGSCWRMHYLLKDVDESNVLTILGPGCICDGPWSCCCENKFTVRICCLSKRHSCEIVVLRFLEDIRHGWINRNWRYSQEIRWLLQRSLYKCWYFFIWRYFYPLLIDLISNRFTYSSKGSWCQD